MDDSTFVEGVPLKYCPSCDKFFPPTKEFFYGNKARWDKLTAYCKKCQDKRKKKFEQENPNYHRDYAKTHRGQYNQRTIAWRKAHKEQSREYEREWYHKNREHILEHKKEYNKEYKKRPDFKERRTVMDRNARARRRNVQGKHTVKEIKDQLKRQKGKCYWCGKKLNKDVDVDAPQVDHVIPLARGGTNDISNIVIACAACNQSKNDSLPSEWRNNPSGKLW